jgi:hypothetical protein
MPVTKAKRGNQTVHSLADSVPSLTKTPKISRGLDSEFRTTSFKISRRWRKAISKTWGLVLIFQCSLEILDSKIRVLPEPSKDGFVVRDARFTLLEVSVLSL